MLTNILLFLLVGLIIGVAAAAIMGGRGLGWGMSILLGIVGSVVGSFLFGIMGMTESGLVGQLIVGVIGACLVLFVADRVRRSHPS